MNVTAETIKEAWYADVNESVYGAVRWTDADTVRVRTTWGRGNAREATRHQRRATPRVNHTKKERHE
jgi:hypothetical protein